MKFIKKMCLCFGVTFNKHNVSYCKYDPIYDFGRETMSHPFRLVEVINI